MKILYSVPNRIGAEIQLQEFLENLHPNIEVRVAGYSSSLSKVDYNMAPLARYHKLNSAYKSSAATLKEKIRKYSPDLVISDFDKHIPKIIGDLGIESWYCSSVHILRGIVLPPKMKISKYIYILRNSKNMMDTSNKADRYYMISPFKDFDLGPIIKINPDYEWLTPYYTKIIPKQRTKNVAVILDKKRISKLCKTLNAVDFDIIVYCHVTASLVKKYRNIVFKDIEDQVEYCQDMSETKFFFTLGETNYISDAIYSGIPNICVSANLNDPETLLNATYCNYLNLGSDVGQIELMDEYSVDELERFYNKEYTAKGMRSIVSPYLHEEVEDYARCI